MRRITTRNRPFAVLALAAAMLLASCDGHGIPSTCDDATDMAALVAARHRLNSAQDEILRLGMGGSPYVAAKFAPLPDFKDDPDAYHAVKTLRGALQEFADALRRCRGKSPRAPP